MLVLHQGIDKQILLVLVLAAACASSLERRRGTVDAPERGPEHLHRAGAM